MAKSKTAEEPRKAARTAARPKAASTAARTEIDTAPVSAHQRAHFAQVVADTLGGLTRAELRAAPVEFWQGECGELPLLEGEGGVVSLPLAVRAGGAEAEGLLVITRPLAAALINMMVGEDGEATLEAFDDLHRSVLAEAVAGVVTGLQEALQASLGRFGTLATRPEVEDDAARLEGEVLSAGTVLSGDGFEGTLALVLPADRTSDLLARVSSAPTASSGLPASHFPQLIKDPDSFTGQNLGILLDVPMQMVAVLGRKGVKLRDLLAMGPGSIMELDKMAGEPLELLVNGKLIGYGEVIVLDEKFGIKVRDVVNPQDRLRSANL